MRAITLSFFLSIFIGKRLWKKIWLLLSPRATAAVRLGKAENSCLDCSVMQPDLGTANRAGALCTRCTEEKIIQCSEKKKRMWRGYISREPNCWWETCGCRTHKAEPGRVLPAPFAPRCTVIHGGSEQHRAATPAKARCKETTFSVSVRRHIRSTWVTN